MSLKLPHISRFISATLLFALREFSLWSILTVLIVYNIYAALSSPPAGFQPLLVAVMQPTTSSDAHINLAHWYRQNGVFDKAKNELVLASDGPSVLGAQASPMDILTAWENEPVRLKKDYRYWQTVIKEKPDYRDAYLALAALAYQLGYKTDTKQYVEKIRAIDPGLAIGYQLSRLLE
ncbi:MAG: hypothetical protein AAB889_04380 [Patescibacteria group bacterium]